MVSEARRAYLRDWRARRKESNREPVGDPAPSRSRGSAGPEDRVDEVRPTRRPGRPRASVAVSLPDPVVDGLSVAIAGLSQTQRDQILQRIRK